MIVIVPVHNQTRNVLPVLNAYLKQTQSPQAIVLIFDRCTDNSRELAAGMQPSFERAGIGLHLHDTSEFGAITGFGAGRARDCGLSVAHSLGAGPFLFTDGDCVPALTLVEHHAGVLQVPHARISCGRRYDTLGPGEEPTFAMVLPDAQDDVRNGAHYMDGLVCSTGVDRLVFNPTVFESSWICWSCNLGMNAAAVALCRAVNSALSGTADRVFSPVFDGRWGGEDGFVGLSVFRCGGETVMLSERSWVKHIWHPRKHTNLDHLRLVQRQDFELQRAIFERRVAADVTVLNVDFNINRNHVDPWVLTQVKDYVASKAVSSIQEAMDTDEDLAHLVAAIMCSGYLQAKPGPCPKLPLTCAAALSVEQLARELAELKTKLYRTPFGVTGSEIATALPVDFRLLNITSDEDQA